MKYELTCINCPMGCRITADDLHQLPHGLPHHGGL